MLDKKRVLGACPQEKAFYLCTGQRYVTIHSLVMALSSLSFEAFASHVNAQKNDFSTWIRDVFGDQELARRLENLKDKDKMVDIILNRLRELQN